MDFKSQRELKRRQRAVEDLCTGLAGDRRKAMRELRGVSLAARSGTDTFVAGFYVGVSGVCGGRGLGAVLGYPCRVLTY